MSWQALAIMATMLVLLAALVGGIGLHTREAIPQGLSILLAVLAAAAFTLSAVAAWPA